MAEEEKYVLFKDIQENMYEINVKCVVDEMSYIVVIPREDGSESMVGHLFIHDDEYQQLRLTLWDDNTVYLETLSPGSVIDIKKAYSRMDSDGSIYLQLSKQGTITELSGETKK